MKLEDAGNWASEKKSEFFLNKTKWLGHEIDENGIKPSKEKVKAIINLKHPENQKQLEYLGAIQFVCKISTEIIGKNRKIAKITDERLQMELGKRTRGRLY